MIRNCLFEDYDLYIRVGMDEFIQHDKHGYFIDLTIRKSDVTTLLENTIIPKFSGDKFKLRAHIGNNCQTTINGVKVRNYSDPILNRINMKKLIPKEIVLAKYTKPRYDRRVYATKLIFTLPLGRPERTL